MIKNEELNFVTEWDKDYIPFDKLENFFKENLK